MGGDRNSSRVTSDRVVENSSQEVSPFEAVEALLGLIKVEVDFMTSETILKGVGDETSGD